MPRKCIKHAASHIYEELRNLYYKEYFQAIAEIADNLRIAIDENLYSCGVFLDFSKSIDTVHNVYRF